MGIFCDNQYVINLSPPILQLSRSTVCLSFLLFCALDVDECSKDNVCIQGQCLNTDGSFLCLCEAGFKFNADTGDCEGKTPFWCPLMYVIEIIDPKLCHEVSTHRLNQHVSISRLIVMLHLGLSVPSVAQLAMMDYL